MGISKELYLAILSMDAYNRGYGAGIADGQGTKDEAGNDIDGLGEAGKLIGTATVLNIPLPSGSQTASFYAVAYTMGADAPQGLAGKTVISYRGTDTTSLFSDPFAADPTPTPPFRVVTDAIRIPYARHTPKTPQNKALRPLALPNVANRPNPPHCRLTRAVNQVQIPLQGAQSAKHKG